MLRLRSLASARLPSTTTLSRTLSTTSSLSSSSTTPAQPKSIPLPPIVTQTNPHAVPSVAQAPNAPATWSTNQAPRPAPASAPRFEQLGERYDLQPAPLSAMEMVNSEPIIMSEKRIAVCDGGGGPLGHPKIFINLDKPGPRPCGYCGLRFQRAAHHHH